MLLAIDIGNTNVKLGVYDAAVLRHSWRLKSDAQKMPDEYGVLLASLLNMAGLATKDMQQAAICSSVPPLVGTFIEVCQRFCGITPLVVGAGVKTGMKVLYEDPRAVGADRIAGAVAGHHKYGGPIIIADCGTASVFDAITRDGEYLGGAIAPGMQLSADALVSRTAMLRRIEMVSPKGAIGRNTVHAMQSGIIFGYVGLVKELVARFKSELGDDARVIGTGGLASVIARAGEVFDVLEPDLTLEGLRLIHEMNQDS
ncbi:MAG: type III pantothenate kinase [Dehalococcoidia bacterium]|nr:type III pantothenate kinase [Dehalococcoidia bacterium]